MFALVLLNAIFSPQKQTAMAPNESGFKTVNGIQLYYEIYGEGTPLVLIHGGGGSILNDFQEVIPIYSEKYKVIGIDLQNHGRSDHRSIPATFEQDVDDVAELLLQLDIHKAHFLGFSNGGNTAMQIAFRHPNLVDKLIVASSMFKREGMISGFFDGFENATLDMMPKSLQENFLKLNPNEQKLQNMFEKDSRRMQHFKDWDEAVLKSIQAPTLLINGDQDVVRNEHILEMNKLIPNSQVFFIPATHGSYLMPDMDGNLDQKCIEKTTKKILSFLKVN